MKRDTQTEAHPKNPRRWMLRPATRQLLSDYLGNLLLH